METTICRASADRAMIRSQRAKAPRLSVASRGQLVSDPQKFTPGYCQAADRIGGTRNPGECANTPGVVADLMRADQHDQA